jgi:TetR/AcrR family transcriptional regulator, transcriptional repressor for nem operon
MKGDLGVHDEIASGFARWKDLFERGLTSMRDRGDLRRDADPAHLAYALMSAFQGGMLLAQAADDVEPLRASLYAALRYVGSFAPRGRQPRFPEDQHSD